MGRGSAGLEVVLQPLFTGLETRCGQGRVWVRTELGARRAAVQEGAGQTAAERERASRRAARKKGACVITPRPPAGGAGAGRGAARGRGAWPARRSLGPSPRSEGLGTARGTRFWSGRWSSCGKPAARGAVQRYPGKAVFLVHR